MQTEGTSCGRGSVGVAAVTAFEYYRLQFEIVFPILLRHWKAYPRFTVLM